MSKVTFRYILFPFSLLYWVITYVRNKLFDKEIYKQTSFNVPIISVGNITVGGTGKTPHVQFLLDALSQNTKVATLSRGYGRRSKGFLLATEKTNVFDLGDEPYLLHKRFPNVPIAVCEKRVDGVQALLKKHADTQCVILDDAFQHRHIKPGLQIVLVDYSRPLYNDFVFPAGNMREGLYGLQRAHIVIVTKCPENVSKYEQETWRNKLKMQEHQHLFFTKTTYGDPYNYITKEKISLGDLASKKHVLLISGIAQPKMLEDYVGVFAKRLTHVTYKDHHTYTHKDYLDILVHFKTNFTRVLTTEKDIYKLQEVSKGQLIIHVLPIVPEFLDNRKDEFVKLIFDFIQKK